MNLDPNGHLQQWIGDTHDRLDKMREGIRMTLGQFVDLRARLIQAGPDNQTNLEFTNSLLTRLTGWLIADLNRSTDVDEFANAEHSRGKLSGPAGELDFSEPAPCNQGAEWDQLDACLDEALQLLGGGRREER